MYKAEAPILLVINMIFQWIIEKVEKSSKKLSQRILDQ